MFGFNYIKFDAMTFAVLFKNGNVHKKGKGLSFWYYAPKSSIAAIQLGSYDIQFIFKETTYDFQTINVQGQITYNIQNPDLLAEVLDFTIQSNKALRTENFEIINQRLNNEAQTATSKFIQSIGIKEAIRSAREIGDKIMEGFGNSDAIKQMGIEVVNVDVLRATPSPEMSRALETETREALQKNADQAIYQRRIFAVEQEHRIKETELNTQITIQEKEKQIEEKQAQRRLRDEENNRVIRELQADTDVSVEEVNTKLVEMKTQNMVKEAEAKGILFEKTILPYKQFDWKQLMAISTNEINAQDHIALAFRELAEKGQTIEHLNIAPDMLQSFFQNK